MPLYVVREDISRMAVDAVVAAGNEWPHTPPTGGAEASIHAAAGPELWELRRMLGHIPEGEARLTRGYALPSPFVIHTAGPKWLDGHSGEEERLRACYLAALRLAASKGMRKLAFPLISAGANGYPRREALRVARETIGEFLAGHEMTVYLTVFDRESYLASEALFRDVQAYVDQHYVDFHFRARQSVPIEAASGRPEPPAETAKPKEKREPPRPVAHSMDLLACESHEVPQPKRLVDDEDLPEELRQWLREMDEGFSARLLRLIDERGMTDPECYRRANIDRKLFSKIRSNPGYTPRKPTVMALCIALELDLAQTRDLLSRAGYGMSHASKFDVIVEYFIVNGIYDVFAINAALLAMDQPLLGNLE